MAHYARILTRTVLAAALCGASLAQADPITDARTEGAASMALSMNERLASDAIEVKVANAKAVVSGTTANEDDKALAAQLVQAVTGITAIENRIAVHPALAERPAVKPARLIELDDLTLAATLRARFSWSTPTRDSPLDIRVEGGVVTLKGQALTAQAKEWAGALAADTKGTIVVNNLISLRAPDTGTTQAETQAKTLDAGVTDAWIASQVANSFHYDRRLDALRLEVKAREGIVTLTGEVDSQPYKTHAVAIARHIRGVRGVDADLLKVAARIGLIEG
jgi:osmotically-inducible protein OsmY